MKGHILHWSAQKEPVNTMFMTLVSAQNSAGCDEIRKLHSHAVKGQCHENFDHFSDQILYLEHI